MESKTNEVIKENLLSISSPIVDEKPVIKEKKRVLKIRKREERPRKEKIVINKKPIEIEEKITQEKEKIIVDKKPIEIKEEKQKEKTVIDEKNIIPPFIKNRPKKNKKQEFKESKENQEFKEEIKTEIEQILKIDKPKKENRTMKINKLKDIIIDDKNLLEDEIEKIREQMMDKERAIDFLYNGERQEDYLIKRKKNKKNKL